MSVSAGTFRRVGAALATAGLAIGLAGTAAVPAAGDGGGATTTEFRYFQAAVNLPPDAPGANGFAGAVSFIRVVDGETSVDVFVSRSTPVACPDGEGTASVTVRTVTHEATEPGPVVLEIDRRLRTAHGDAVVDLVVEESPGCGEPETATTLPAQAVSIDATGTSVRFRTGIIGVVSSEAGSERNSTIDLSRDGTGSARVGSFFTDAMGAAFLKFAVERTRVVGTPPEAPANFAPPDGLGAHGAYTTTFEPPGGLGVVSEDVAVTASTTAAPESATTITAFAEQQTAVACPAGGTAVVTEVFDGAGQGVLDVDRRLASATASGTFEVTRLLFDGCVPDAEPVVETVTVPVSLSLTATGPRVRVRDIRFQETPGEGTERTDTRYVARDAAGTISVDDIAGETGLASISRAGAEAG